MLYSKWRRRRLSGNVPFPGTTSKRSGTRKESNNIITGFSGVKIPANDELTHWSGAFIKYLREFPQGNEHISETLRRLIEELLELRRQLADLMKHLKTVVLNDQKKTVVIKRLAGIPGIGFTSAVIIYSELIDIGRFSRFDKLCSYVGLVPDIRASGDKQTPWE